MLERTGTKILPEPHVKWKYFLHLSKLRLNKEKQTGMITYKQENNSAVQRDEDR